MAVAIRGLAGRLSVLEILAIRSGIGLLIMLRAAGGASRPAAGDPHPAPGAASVAQHRSISARSILWARSLLLLPLATVFALEFTMPAWTLLLAPCFLGERMTREPDRRGGARMIGVLVILRPGMETFQPAALMVLTAALGYAVHDHLHQASSPRRKARSRSSSG